MTIDFPSRPAGTNGSADADSGSARLFDAGLFGSTDVSLQSWFVLVCEGTMKAAVLLCRFQVFVTRLTAFILFAFHV